MSTKPFVPANQVEAELFAQLSAATARAEAAEAKVRDVETLVDHVKAIHGHEREVTIGSCSLVIHDEGNGDLLVVTGAPEFCIIKAAQWVRENSPPQKKPTDDGGRGEGA